MGGTLTVRPANRSDAAAIAAIYAHYVVDSVVTFEIDPPSPADMAARIDDILPHYPYLVAEQAGQLIGYAYGSRLYDRAAYRWVAEAAIYVDHEAHGRGVGRALYRALIASLKAQGFQAVVGKITLPNPASIALHEAFGFARCGILAKSGFKHGAWYDVGLYQLDLGDRPDLPPETVPFID